MLNVGTNYASWKTKTSSKPLPNCKTGQSTKQQIQILQPQYHHTIPYHTHMAHNYLKQIHPSHSPCFFFQVTKVIRQKVCFFLWWHQASGHEWNRGQVTIELEKTRELVGGVNPCEKYKSKWESSPNRGEHKNVWNHHLENFWIPLPIDQVGLCTPFCTIKSVPTTKWVCTPQLLVSTKWLHTPSDVLILNVLLEWVCKKMGLSSCM